MKTFRLLREPWISFNIRENWQPLTLDGEDLEDMKYFVYLVFCLIPSGQGAAEVERHIGAAMSAFLRLKRSLPRVTRDFHGNERAHLSSHCPWCPWCSRYRLRKWTRRHEFKSWTRRIAFHIALIPLGKVWIQLFSLQLWVNSRTD